MDLSHIPILDHHAHPLHRPETTQSREAFLSWFTESSDPTIYQSHVPHTLFLRTAVRWLAQLLDCEPTLEAVLAARAQQEPTTWTRRLFAEANIAQVLCDYGYGGVDAYTPAEMSALLPCPIRPILRLETLAQELILQHESFDQVVEAYANTIAGAREAGYVALKSIIAYRTGLAVAPVSTKEAATAFPAVKEKAQRSGQIRLDDPVLTPFFLWLALEQNASQQLPVQFHTGFGDKDADLRQANPLHLRTVIERWPFPIVLLHAGWPFYREVAHLAALYGHVWLDLSLAIPFATIGIPAMLRQVLGMAPWSKILFATDAFTMPEIYWLAARWGRWGLGQILAEMVAAGFITAHEAYAAAEMVLNNTAHQLYGV
jgi:predicted TIM-barrel fold metal-dependent hydrolase